MSGLIRIRCDLSGTTRTSAHKATLNGKPLLFVSANVDSSDRCIDIGQRAARLLVNDTAYTNHIGTGRGKKAARGAAARSFVE